MRIRALLWLLAIPALPAAAGVNLNFFPASSFNADTAVMDATLGITGYSIDTFESAALLPGLSFEVSGGVPDTVFAGTLPALFDTNACGSLTSNAPWDGNHAVINTPTNSLNNCFTPSDIALEFSVAYAPGTKSLGIGLGNFQTEPGDHELFVNGEDLGTIEALAGVNWTAGFERNAYLRIDATGDMVISSVMFKQQVGDVLIIDRVAIAPVPEPSSLVTTALGMLCLASVRRRRSAAAR